MEKSKFILFILFVGMTISGCSKEDKKVDTTKQKYETTTESENKNVQTEKIDTSKKKNLEEEKKLTPDEIIKNHKPNLTLINADLTAYLGKSTDLYGYAKIDDYFNWGYSDAKATHFGVNLDDGKRWVIVYFRKNKFKELMVLLSEKEHVPLKIKGMLYRNKITDSNGSIQEPMFEGLDWEELK